MVTFKLIQYLRRWLFATSFSYIVAGLRFYKTLPQRFLEERGEERLMVIETIQQEWIRELFAKGEFYNDENSNNGSIQCIYQDIKHVGLYSVI